jgi:hypothetical protein
VAVAAPVSEEADLCGLAAGEVEKALRPAYRKCYVEGFKKNPNLEGTVRIAVNVDAHGKISSVKAIEPYQLDAPAVACMVKATKAHKFDVSTCPQKTLTIVHKYPR